jgi:hypothetical protein
LLPHPSPGRVRELAVTVTRTSRDRLALNYRLTGDLGALRLPEPAPPLRADGLWKHSCFEAFIGHGGSGEYCEFNFSPSGAWAAYQFSGYRKGMAPWLKGAAPHIVQQLAGVTFELAVVLDLSGLARASGDNRLRLDWPRSSKTMRRCHTGRSGIRRRNPISTMQKALWLRSIERCSPARMKAGE